MKRKSLSKLALVLSGLVGCTSSIPRETTGALRARTGHNNAQANTDVSDLLADRHVIRGILVADDVFPSINIPPYGKTAPVYMMMVNSPYGNIVITYSGQEANRLNEIIDAGVNVELEIEPGREINPNEDYQVTDLNKLRIDGRIINLEEH